MRNEHGTAIDPDRFAEQTMPDWEKNVRIAQEDLIAASPLTATEKFMNFPVFTSRQKITRFLLRYELFKMIQHIPGFIFECGVLFGGGLFAFAHFSTIFEPMNAQRRIVGFDTFEGLTELHRKDFSDQPSSKLQEGAMAAHSYEELTKAIHMFDQNRVLAHLPKIELVKGDLRQTMPQYFSDHNHALVALLYLDLDIYLSTKAAIEACLPRMPKGAIIAFDEFSCERWPDETSALMDTLGVSGRELRRFPFDTYLSYLIL